MPAVERLDAEQQATYDDMWSNMLLPADRLNREVLLDTIMAFQLFQVGVDELNMTSTKRLADKTVTMTIRYQKDHPDMDQFAVLVADRTGKILRTEAYSFAEVRKRYEDLADSRETVSAGPQTAEESVQRETRERERREELERRLNRVMSATQPASRPAEEGNRLTTPSQLLLERLMKPLPK